MAARIPTARGAFRRRAILAGTLFAAAFAYPAARADEIRFRNPGGLQAGTVVEEDGGTITVRFPRSAIESVTRAPGRRDDEPARGPASPLEERVRELEKKVSSLRPAGPGPAATDAPGNVSGTIRWRDRPLARGRVLFVPWKYAGLSPRPEGARDGGGVTPSYQAATDDAGRYRIEGVPPGEYLAYWSPGPGSEWIRRLRDRPDLTVRPDGTTVFDIPGGGK